MVYLRESVWVWLRGEVGGKCVGDNLWMGPRLEKVWGDVRREVG
jgi:hypothetical protein